MGNISEMEPLASIFDYMFLAQLYFPNQSVVRVAAPAPVGMTSQLQGLLKRPGTKGKRIGSNVRFTLGETHLGFC